MAGSSSTPADLFSVAGKTALVTGGASGIGLMVTKGLADAGAVVHFTSRKPEAIEAARRVLGDPPNVVGIRADLNDDTAVAKLVEEVSSQVDRLDLLVNNAGVTWYAPLDDYPDPAFDRCFQVNLKAPFALVRDLLPLLRRAAAPEDPARVVNVGSIGGIRPGGTDNYAYPASKAAVHMLTRQLALALAPEFITVNAIAPGPFKTKMMAPAMTDDSGIAAVASSVPLGRWGEPDDIIGAVVYLASRAAAFVTGTVLVVDGGASAG